MPAEELPELLKLGDEMVGASDNLQNPPSALRIWTSSRNEQERKKCHDDERREAELSQKSTRKCPSTERHVGQTEDRKAKGEVVQVKGSEKR